MSSDKTPTLQPGGSYRVSKDKHGNITSAKRLDKPQKPYPGKTKMRRREQARQAAAAKPDDGNANAGAKPNEAKE